jgi:tetratricopeptide (TPR) repeat protein
MLPRGVRNTVLSKRRFKASPASWGIALLVGASLLVAQPAGAEVKVTFDTSLSVFSVLAAVNAAGYDAGAYASPGPVRERVRARLAQSEAPSLAALKKFYAEHHREDPSAELAQYVSFALVVSGPPNFEFTMPANELPPDVLSLAGLNELIRDFYREAGIPQLWESSRAEMERELARYQPEIQAMIERSNGYFRFQEGYRGRTFSMFYDSLGAPGQVNARNYGANYYLVFSPGPDSPLPEMRHAYLHFLLDPLAGEHVKELQNRSALLAIAQRAENLPSHFHDDFGLLFIECLIQAAELRMDKIKGEAQVQRLAEADRNGFILVRTLVAGLESFEKSEPSIRIFFPELVAKIDVAAETARFANFEFAHAEAQPRKLDLNEVDATLMQVERHLAKGRADAAEPLLRSILARYGENPRALYNMAVVATLKKDAEQAKEYFQRTLQRAREPRLLAWSHIYLGRIYDMEDRRELALSEYRAALAAGDSSEAVRSAAQRGLEKPFRPPKPASPESGPPESE